MHCRPRPPLPDLEIFEMALETGAHVHIAHSSLSRGFGLAETFRNMGAQTTGEACIQYLCMTENDIVRLGSKGKCNPRFRTADEVQRMWQSLIAGKIAYVSTDHAPWPLERKTLPDIVANSAGLPGLQTFAPLMFSLLEERGLPLTLMATYCAERSAQMHGLWPQKGALRVGSDADLCLLERGEFVFEEASIHDRPEMCWSPYHGRKMRARVAATYLRGKLVWDGTNVLAKPGDGRFISRSRG
jgi:allantoinase